MDESKEAEIFCEELDSVLAGKAVAAGIAVETQKDLALAAKLCGLDMSPESEVKGSLKARLLAPKPGFRLRDWFAASPSRARAFALAGLAFLILLPAFEHFYLRPTSRSRLRDMGAIIGGGDGSSIKRISAPGVPNRPRGISQRGPGTSSGGNFDQLNGLAAKQASDFNRSGQSAAYSLDRVASRSGEGTFTFGGGSGGNSGRDSKSVGGSLEFLRQRAKQDQDWRSALLNSQKTGMGLAEKYREKPILIAGAPQVPLSGGGLRGLGAISGGGGGFNAYQYFPGQIYSGQYRPPYRQPWQGYEGEGYDRIDENRFTKVADAPLSTFSIDVDKASYANVRRFLDQNQLPPIDAVRIEEMINYFHYDYPEPEGPHPFSVTADQADCPWDPAHKLVRIGLKGRSLTHATLPPSNLVFLIDSSGSMADSDKLPLLKQSFQMLVDQLRPQDRVAIVTYAGSAGIVLQSTPGDQKKVIMNAINQLQADGSTAGSEGIQLAYRVAQDNFMTEGNNRVILATDGDFNVGVTSDDELVRMIEQKREHGVFLTVLGVGQGNYQDAKMQKLADHGNGNYAYLDSLDEANKVLVRELAGTLVTLAKDVKLQVEFNPARVESYRLIGYEKRALKAQDFNNDKKDAGELGAGHTVTALYEVVPTGVPPGPPSVDPLKYQRKAEPAGIANDEMLTVKLRYKEPLGSRTKLAVAVVKDFDRPFAEASRDFRFAAAVAGFGMLLRDSPHKSDLTYKEVESIAADSIGRDEHGDKAEALRLMERARLLTPQER